MKRKDFGGRADQGDQDDAQDDTGEQDDTTEEGKRPAKRPRGDTVGEDGQGGGEDEDEGLTEAEVASLSRAEIEEALEQREGQGNLAPDRVELEFRACALDLLPSADWIKSPACASLILAWLESRRALAPEKITLVADRRTAISDPPVPAPSAAQLGEVWAAVTAGTQVSQHARDNGCEYLAQAICELIDEQFPQLARLRLSKTWLVARGYRLHPPQNWFHHVAPVLECADGPFVLDIYLADQPITRSAWLSRARGGVPADKGFDCDRPWELIGRPQSAQDGFDPHSYIPRADAKPQIDECRKPATTST